MLNVTADGSDVFLIKDGYLRVVCHEIVDLCQLNGYKLHYAVVLTLNHSRTQINLFTLLGTFTMHDFFCEMTMYLGLEY